MATSLSHSGTLELILLIIALIFHSCCSDSSYFIDPHENCNNINNTWADNPINTPNNSTKWFMYLGIFNNTQQCIHQCLNMSISNSYRCESYSYYTSLYNESDWKLHCYGRFGFQYGVLWSPMIQQNVNCGRIIYKCQTDLDCSLNGKCSTKTGNCTCNKAWTGYHCNKLNLLPTIKESGYHIINDNNSGKNTSSWGGSVLVNTNNVNDDTKYYMYLSEFDNHCGVNSWHLNSVVTLAQSINGYNGSFERIEIIHPHFAHEPSAIFGPNNEIVLYYASYNFSGINECQCNDGSTPPSCKQPARKFINIMQYAEPNNFNGPWYRTVIFPERSVDDTDTNLSGVILENGTFIGLLRDRFNQTANSGPRYIYSATSTDWKNGSLYMQHHENALFPQVGGTEDPFVYIDCNLYFHAIFHNSSPQDLASICGGHAYSIDGIEWIYGGVSYGNVVHFTDNTDFSFSRRERPHFIFDDDGCTPIALTNGAQYGGQYGDATYTLLQPIKH